MKAVVQRVTSACVFVDGNESGRIGQGVLVFVGIGRKDGPTDIDYIADKIKHLRVFDDDAGLMNRSVTDVGGSVLLVSEFTLYGDCRRGRRPSFVTAARSEYARQMYELLVERLSEAGVGVVTGEFQAMMAVELVNDGPVTLWLDSASR